MTSVTMDMDLDLTTCWCGTPFMLPRRLLECAMKTGHTIYCPHGHMLKWRETEADTLRRERDRLKQDTARLEDERREAIARAERAELATHKLKKRAAAGTCPCCHRTFSRMATHMKRQHPDFVADTAAKVVPIKLPIANAN